ncbi:MAG: MiaB/RimO family radical SAM methylthiotransferase [Bdellovibrio bacteriovorus]
MSDPPRVRLHSLGCRLNEAELEAWARGFRRLGLRVAAEGEPADLVVVNTCAVTQEAARKSRQMLRRSRRLDPQARLVVSGCLSTLEPGSLGGGPDLVVGNQDKDRLVEIAATSLDLPAVPLQDALAPSETLFARGRQRAFVKVQDGCRHRCTFCITTLARGDERSRPIAEVVGLVNRLTDSGIQEILLTGVHLGGYGSDLGGDPAGGLADLIRALLAETAMPRIRLGSLEPWDLPSGFWGLFADSRLMPHLHLPMQSGSERVLRRMGRRCRPAQLARLAAEGRAAVPGLNLGTDIILGFPGETESDWEETLVFVEAVGFGQIHAFPYSPRPGTRAASLPGRVDAATQRRRAQELTALAKRLRRGVLEAQVGTGAAVLREEAPRPAGPAGLFGYTPNYLPVRIDPDPAAPPAGEIIGVRILGVTADGEMLRGRRESPG